MIVQRVRPDNGGREGKWVALSIVVILSVAALLLPHHQAKSGAEPIAAHQVAIEELEQGAMGLIADLRLAHEEIRQLQTEQEGSTEALTGWASIDELKALWLAPFVEDKSWQYYGRHQWRQIAPAVYQGIAAHHEGAPSMLLVSDHDAPEIWLDLTGKAKALPVSDATLSDSQLIQAGWVNIAFNAQRSAHQAH